MRNRLRRKRVADMEVGSNKKENTKGIGLLSSATVPKLFSFYLLPITQVGKARLIGHAPTMTRRTTLKWSGKSIELDVFVKSTFARGNSIKVEMSCRNTTSLHRLQNYSLNKSSIKPKSER